METYDWISKIKTNIFVLRLMGLWPNGDKTYGMELYTLYLIVLSSTFAVGNVSFRAINVYFIVDNVQSLVGTAYLMFIEILAVLKAYYLVKNMKILKKRLNVFKSDWFQPKSSEQKQLIESSIRFWKRVFMSFLMGCIGCNTFGASYPLLDKSTYSEARKLPFMGWYPYDYTASPFYEITYVYQVLGMFYLTSIHINVDTLVSAFNVFTGCQIDMLCDNLRHLADNVNKPQEIIYDRIIECVSQYKNILKFIKDSTHFHSWILFWHLIFSGVSIGITMFKLTIVEPLSAEFYSLVTFGFAITIQIFMYCWFANEVEIKSHKLAYAVFESEWIDLSENLKKKLLFFTMHLHKPLEITALNVFTLSLDTFMRILKTAWSYFALLCTVNSKKN